MLEAEKFFEDNRKNIEQLKSLPNPNASDEEIALWILQGGHGNWLELDLKIPVNDFLKDELLAHNKYVGHRDADTDNANHQGWLSCTLHGISVEKTNHWSIYGYNKEPKYFWTSLGQKTKNIQKFCQSLPFEKLARVRFMKLKGRGYINPHDDNSSEISWDRVWELPLPINIAIEHPLSCFMTVENSGVVPFKNGKAFLVNILKTHSVINFDSSERKHLIVHGIVGNRKDDYCKLLADSYRKNYDKIQRKIQIK